MRIPEVIGYGSLDVESFEDYLARWPEEFRGFPRDLTESWVYRHWGQFKEEWMPQGALSWNYELRKFSNSDVLEIKHFDIDLKTIDYWGDQLLVDRQRRETWLAQFMLSHGTVPAPILVLNCQVPCDPIEHRVWRFAAARDAMRQLITELRTER